MIRFTNASLQRGQKPLFADINLTIYHGQRCGITGANGTGKSSLFQLLLGGLAIDKGDMEVPAQAVIAHVAQETPGLAKPAIEYVIDGDQILRKAEAEIERLQQLPELSESQSHALANALAHFEEVDGYSAHSRAGKLLDGLGFSQVQMQHNVSEFSGGWRMRLNLAQALMCKSDILLLDEPTNHLDLEAVVWLEQWLGRYSNTLLLISHDRDFLNAVCNHVIHVSNLQLDMYKGNYDDFERMRAEKMEQHQAQYQKQQREISHLEQFITRFKAKASKAKQAQSRVKALEKMVKLTPLQQDSPFTFSFAEPERAGDPLVRLDDVQLGYGDTPLLTEINFSLRAGDRYGILGHNGSGKSTLVKHLASKLPALEGKVHQTDRLKLGYFAQHQLDELDVDASPLLIIQRLDKTATEQSIKNFLGGFNFKGDRVTEKVKIFSGGEKARLALAKIVYLKPNLLLLDEPTNHLDLQMRDALTLALQSFSGAIVVISHDRYLLRACCDEFLLVEDGAVTMYQGDLDDYRQTMLKSKSSAEKNNKDSSQSALATGNVKKEKRQLTAAQREQLKPYTQKLRALEKEMGKVTKQLGKINEQLTDVSLYEAESSSLLQELLTKQGALKKQLDSVETDWMSVSEQIEILQA
jgi:ATP-binding cassette subfamily F protein 3